jgi:hypothetical protein
MDKPNGLEHDLHTKGVAFAYTAAVDIARLIGLLLLMLVLWTSTGCLECPAAGQPPAGSVIAWGYSILHYVQPTGASFVAVASGDSHALVLNQDGTVVAWGWNPFGQCDVPSGLGGVIAIAAGGDHSLALKQDGTVIEWGDTDVPSGLSGVTAIGAGGSDSLAVKQDGTVVAWDSSSECSVPSGLSGVVAVAAGQAHSLALKRDGTVVAWGNNDDDQCNVPSGLSGVIAVAAGWDHSLALKQDGTVVAWGDNWDGECDVPSGLGGVIAIAAGWDHSLALRQDGTVVAWGWDAFGQCDVPSGLSWVTGIAAGNNYSLALVAPPPLVSPPTFGGCTYLPSKMFQMEVFGRFGQNYALEVSTNLINWSSVRTFTCTNSPTILLDSASGRVQFYRIAQ